MIGSANLCVMLGITIANIVARTANIIMIDYFSKIEGSLFKIFRFRCFFSSDFDLIFIVTISVKLKDLTTLKDFFVNNNQESVKLMKWHHLAQVYNINV